MHDPRETKLAELLINHSTRLQPGEHVLIEAFDIPSSMVIEAVRAARRAGGHPHVIHRDNRVMAALIRDGEDGQFEAMAAHDLNRMQGMDAYLGLRGGFNINEMSDVPAERMKAWGRLYMQPVHMQERVKNTRWCVLRWPTPSMAQLAGQGTEAFEKFYFDVCTLDYAAMDSAAAALSARMNATDAVQLLGPGDTDLTFSIKDIPAVPCCGTHNIPDGECFTAPVRDSVNGVIHFNTPTIYHGTSFKNVRLEFKDGKVIKATSDQNNDALEAVFESDEGARYVGEFAIGFNPYVREPMMDILFDEKIAGSLHFTPGQAYEDADNGNRSDIHWDLVLIQREDYGGGEIRFDGETIRRDGMFVTEDLLGLNPEALSG
ncbi:MAG: aminopeptidase [Phycisphaerales bacterium]|nr:aminopeptidase [Phycisphaerales bacterium]